MATLESLHELLKSASASLDRAAGEIRDVPLEPARRNILRIAEILERIDAIQNEIYRLKPELIPEHLWEVSKGEWPALIVEGALRRAARLEASGAGPKAIEVLEFLIRCQPSAAHLDRVTGALSRLRQLGAS